MKTIHKSLFIFILIILSNSFKVHSQSNDNETILVKDYSEFLYYVRDSISREIIAKQILDFSNGIFPKKAEVFLLNWRINIDLDDSEINELLTEYYIYKLDNKYYVDTSYLEYRSSRIDSVGIKVYPNLTKWREYLNVEIEKKFLFKGKWNKELKKSVVPYLTNDQLEAYLNWLEKSKRKNLRKCCRGYEAYSHH